MTPADPQTPTSTPGPRVAVRRPQRADARRNFDALVDAAREVFARDGAAASLEQIARRAGVNIATLYRNFPTRQDLFETVYLDEVEALARAAADLHDQEPWEALAAWLRQFVRYATTKKAIFDALNHQDPMFVAARQLIHDAGRPLLQRAQDAGQARGDATFDDVLFLIRGISGADYVEEAQRERVLAMALDGVRARG
ncbi:TetR/AcrR family transcriptional regulator [Kineosporia succinea]